MENLFRFEKGSDTVASYVQNARCSPPPNLPAQPSKSCINSVPRVWTGPVKYPTNALPSPGIWIFLQS